MRKRGDLAAAAERLLACAGLALVAGAAAAWLAGAQTALTAAFGVTLGVWLVLGSFAEVLYRTASARTVGARLRRLAGLPRTTWGSALGHLGVGLTVLGIVALSAFETEVIADMGPGDTIAIAGYDVTFDRASDEVGPNYRDAVAHFTVRRAGRVVASLAPARRYYPAREMPTTEAAIKTFGLTQLYVTLGEVRDGKIVVRLFDKPFVLLIWIGALVAAAGGTLSLLDRRLRIGLPAPARRAGPGAGGGVGAKDGTRPAGETA